MVPLGGIPSNMDIKGIRMSTDGKQIKGCQQMDIKPNPSHCAYSIDNQPCKRALIGNFTVYEFRHTQRHYTPEYEGVMCFVTYWQFISS